MRLKARVFKVKEYALHSIAERNPEFYAVLYFLNIWLFSLVYCFVPDGFTKKLDLVTALYFSVVTATTLGYGDISPVLDNWCTPALVAAQVLIGVALIGLFLNSISHQLSDRKDTAARKLESEKKEEQTAKALAMFRPTIDICLRTLSQMYRFTAVGEKENFNIRPQDFLDNDFCAQVSKMDFFAVYAYYDSEEKMYSYFIRKNAEFVEMLDKYLMVFSHALPVSTVVAMTKLRSNNFFNVQKMYAHLYRAAGSNRDGRVKSSEFVSGEFLVQYSSHVSDFVKMLLAIIGEVDRATPDDPVIMSIVLSNNISPSVGAAL